MHLLVWKMLSKVLLTPMPLGSGKQVVGKLMGELLHG